MATNLATKYEKQFEAAFKPNSYFDGKVNSKYTFEGAKTIKIYSPVTTPLEDYTRSGANRYGNPSEMDTALQELTLKQDKGFTKTLDRGNYTDQMMSISAGAWMKEEIGSVVTPTTEKYALSEWIRKAGNVLTISAAPTKSTTASALAELVRVLTDNYVPEEGRFLYVPATVFTTLKLSDEFIGIDALGEKAIGKGVIGEFMGAKVVTLPSGFFPDNCYALIARKESLLLPRKISSFKTHNNPPGIDGWLMEGRVYYDAFVLGAKAAGVAALVLENKKQAAPTITVSSGSMTIASSGATAIYYTTDGTDPRYSDSAKAYSAAVSIGAGTYELKAVAYGTFTSDVTTKAATVS